MREYKFLFIVLEKAEWRQWSLVAANNYSQFQQKISLLCKFLTFIASTGFQHQKFSKDLLSAYM